MSDSTIDLLIPFGVFGLPWRFGTPPLGREIFSPYDVAGFDFAHQTPVMVEHCLWRRLEFDLPEPCVYALNLPASILNPRGIQSARVEIAL